MAISESFLVELKDKTDIEDVISSYVPLKKRGRTLVGLCPFHNEKTPSFTVYPDDKHFFCFGCGAGGDAITFIRRIENLDYVEAVKSLAQRAGMNMPEDNSFDDSLAKKRQRLLSANREAARFFNSCLYSDQGKAGLAYFTDRMLTRSTITHFGLGYAPNSWDSLLRYMTSKGYTPEELYEVNLVNRSDKNGRVRYYDTFRDRVMFPIIDLRGNVIAFGGRRLSDEDKTVAKYVNTSDTLVYHKGNAFFALNFAKNNGDGKYILVEGYMDVITLHQAGFTNAIACLGTAFTTEQANLLARYANEVYICYDSDGAGQKATQRALSVLGGTGVNIRVINMVGGKDADEIIKVHGADRFRSLIDGAANKIEYALVRERDKFDIGTDDGRMKYLTAAAEVLARCGSIERDIYAGRLAAETGVSKEAILLKVASGAKKLQRREDEEKAAAQTRMLTDISDPNNPEREKNIRAARAEEILIASLVRNPDFYNKLKDRLSPELFVTSFNRRIFASLLKKLEEGREVGLTFFSDEFNPREMDSVTRIINLGHQIGNTVSECEDCIRVLTQCRGSADVRASELSDEEFRKLFKKSGQ